MKKRWIWLCGFLISTPLILSSISVDAREETRTVEEVHTKSVPINVWAVNDGITLIQTKQWINQVRWNKEIARQEAEKVKAAVQAEGNIGAAVQQQADIGPVISDGSSLYDSSCLYHVMSIDEAHNCWDTLLTYYPITNPDGTTTLVPRQWSVSTAFHIMMCESKGKSNAYNPSGATGLMQVMYGSSDPVENMAGAYRKYQQAKGWGPWLASKGCWG